MAKQTDTPADKENKQASAPAASQKTASKTTASQKTASKSGSKTPESQAPAPAEKKLKNVRYRQSMPEFPEPPRDMEAARRKIVVWGSIGTFIVVGVLIALAILQVAVLEPQRAVASVGGENITVSQLQSQMRLSLSSGASQYNQLLNQISQIQQNSSTDESSAALLAQIYQQQAQQVAARITVDGISQGALDSLVNDALIRQEARKRGITVGADEIQRELEQDFGYYAVAPTPFPTATPAPVKPGDTPGPTAEPRQQPTSVPQAQFQQSLESATNFFKNVGLGEEGLRRTYELRLLDRKLRETLGKDVATTAPHLSFDYLQFNTQDDAKKALSRLSTGSIAFDALISETNTITQPAVIGNGGSIEWTSKASVENQFGTEIAAALDTAALNKPTGIITSSFGGFYVFLPRGREVRELNESELTSARQKPYDEWLAAAQQNPDLVKRLEAPAKFMPSDIRQSITQFVQQQ